MGDQRKPELRGVTRRDVLQAGAAAALVALTSHNKVIDMESLEKQNYQVDLPQRKFFLEAHKVSLAGQDLDEKKIESMQGALNDMLDTYIDQNLAGTEIFTSQETGAEFPYTRIDTAEFAKQLYRKYRGVEPAITGKTKQATLAKEFVLGPVFSTDDGSGFTVWEEQFRRCVEKLPTALEALAADREPERYEIYGMGAPVNTIGLVTPAFVESVKEKGAIRAIGEVQAECIASQLSGTPEEKGKMEVRLWGLSMGGSLA